jgi:iron complex outermembrane receptor protein
MFRFMSTSPTATAALAALAALTMLATTPAQAQALARAQAGEQPSAALVVRVESEGSPISGARVRALRADESEAGATPVVGFTDAAGETRLEVRPGALRLEVAAPGFVLHERAVRVAAGDTLAVEVELDREPFELEGIEVSSTRAGRRVQDEPLRVEVLEREEIEEKMLMTPGNIAMLLNETGGLRVQVTSPSLGAANVRVQGMRGRYTQLLSDGLPLYGGQAGSIGLLQIPPADLGQIEVIKGVASALFGASALGGVINLISRRPEAEPTGELLLNATTQDGQDGTAYLSGPLRGRWAYSLMTGLHRQQRQDLDGTGWADVPSHRRVSARPRVFWTGEGGARALFTVGAMHERREGGTLPGHTLPGGASYRESLETDRFDVGLNARRPTGAGFVTARASLTHQAHDHRFGPDRERDQHRTAFAEIARTGTAGRHTWVVGAALQHDGYRSRTHPAFDYDFTVPALFAQDEVRLTSDLSLSASARWDHHSEYGSKLSPRVSALYRPGAWTMRGSLGRGFFAPTPFVEEIEAAGLGRLAPLERLQSESARTASLDVGRSLGPFELNATVFGSVVEGAVQLVPVEGPDEGVRLVNVPGDTRTAGVEWLARTGWNGWGATASWVYLRATEPDPAGEGRRDVPLTPRHTAGLVVMWEDHDRGLLGVETYFTGRQPLDDNPYRAEGRRQVHLGVLGELRRGAWSVFVNFENLLDVRQTDYDPLVRPQRAPSGRWTVDAWAPVEGFAVNGGVRLRLGGH